MKNLTKSGEVIDMDDKLKEMLDVNIDDIEAKGKKRRNKNKTILAIVLLAAAVVSVCCYWGFMTKKYENALSSANNGDYGTAISDFTALGNFKDSAENAEKARIAQDFISSGDYAAIIEAMQPAVDSLNSNDAGTLDTFYEWETTTLVTRHTDKNALPVVNTKDLNSQEANVLSTFLMVSHAADNLSGATRNFLEEAGYSIDSRFEEVGSDGEVMYSSVNGTESYSCVDIAVAEDALYSQCYQEMVNAVEAQKYSECIDIWDKFNTDGFYALDYKDISDYYYYADGMKLYTSSEEVKLSDIMGSFEQVSNGFRDVDFIIAGIKQQEELTNGEYHNSSEYRMTIDNGHVKVKGPSWDYFENYNGDGEYLIQDGKIQKLQVSIESMLNICNLDITFDNGSIFVKCSIPPREDMQSATGINRSYASSVEHNLSGTCTKAG